MYKEILIDLVFSEENHPMNVLFIDDKFFDWGMDKEDLKNAKDFISQNPALKLKVYENISQHFLQSISDCIGKNIGLSELLDCLHEKRINILDELYSSDEFKIEEWNQFLDYDLYNLKELKCQE